MQKLMTAKEHAKRAASKAANSRWARMSDEEKKAATKAARDAKSVKKKALAPVRAQTTVRP